MKNSKSNMAKYTMRKKLLPLAITVAFGLSACGGEQFGDTNDGLANTGTGVLGDGAATSLLVLGGLVGLGVVLSDDDDDDGVVVTTAGGGSTSGDDGSDDTDGDTDGADDTDSDTDDSADGSDDTDSDTDDSTDGSGGTDDGTDGSDDDNGSSGTTNPTGDPSTTEVAYLEPPDWLLGMWRGTDSNGMSQTAFAIARDIGIGNTGTAIRAYSTIPNVCLHLAESSDSVFQYTIWYPTENGEEIIINKKWINNGDGSLLYIVSGQREDQFIMYKTDASNYLTPPLWLQGRWEGASADGGATIVADINTGNITVGELGGSRTNLFELADQPQSVVRVNQDDGRNYSVTVITPSDTVSNTFASTGTNTLNYTGSAGEASMTRQ